ncbi:MAG: FecR domain-containing protein [Bacteroidota bacterium]|nr:FecR domain-containing protein [Bacteroidota bacterium]
MDNHFFYQLTERYLEGTATAKERQLVEAFYEQLSSEDAAIPEEMKRRVKAAMHKHIQAEIARVPAPVHRIYNWRKIAGSAAIVFALAAGGLFFLKQPSKKERATARLIKSVQEDKTPGGNKAILTLGNGATIMLDSAHNGILATQGNANISKLDSGRLAYTSMNRKPGGIVFNTLSTPRGGQYQLLLPDGTRVWLDAASSIRYPTVFAGNTREVEVTGQVYFEVVHNASHPFSVLAGGVEISDIGTYFNVNTYADEPSEKITLVQGRIAVKDKETEWILKPGEQAEQKNGLLDLKKGVDIAAVMAWKNGQFQLRSTDFATLMRQISRWYDVDISYEGPVPDRKFGGSINRNVNLSRLLEVLHDYGIETKLESKKLIIMN